MNSIRAAFYARVSSEQQATAHTIESQLPALAERAQADGSPVPLERQFVDDGCSGATLVRPAMDRLRDLAAVGCTPGQSLRLGFRRILNRRAPCE